MRNHALADFNEAVTLDPDYTSAVFLRAVVSERKGGLDHAVANETEAIRRDPKLATVCNNRGLHRD
jgi:Tfp pilus assembly protein PilF